MLLDEIFETVGRTKKAWVRTDGRLRLVTKKVEPTAAAETGKPLFPISKPRYPSGDEDHFSRREHEEAEDKRDHRSG